jgi:Flp pilus assembly protein TadD
VIGSSPAFEQQLMQANEWLRQGQLDQAAAACASVLSAVPRHPTATHLLGLVRSRLGDSEEAERLLRRSLELQPANEQFRLGLANFLRRAGRYADAETQYRAVLSQKPDSVPARHQLALTLADLGRGGEAESECRRLLEKDPRAADAWSLLGYILSNQQRLLEAEVAYRRSLELAPEHGLAHHNLGSLLVQMERAEEALQMLERAERLGVPHFELRFARGRALVLLYRIEEAEQEFARAVAERPRHLEAQLNLARLRFMRADPLFTLGLEQALRAAPDNLELQSLLFNILMRAGKYEQAESRIQDALKVHGPLPQLRSRLAQLMLETGRLKEAETEALEAAALQPRDGTTIDTLITILLSRGRPLEAMSFIQTKRAQEPLNQNWIAHEAIAGRLLGQQQYRELFDYARFVRSYHLQPPQGWSSMDELNAALIEVLARRHLFASHPLEQSLRNGSQTTRNLVHDPDPVVQAILQSFRVALQQYAAEIGHHPAHPLLQRNAGRARVFEAWSIELRRDGFHVNHVHPKGWISSSYYVSVPSEVADPIARSGWLKFGEPAHAAAGVGPEYMVQPSAGLLVLFPSYLWHGTTAIRGGEPRVTIAFDALPGA